MQNTQRQFLSLLYLIQFKRIHTLLILQMLHSRHKIHLKRKPSKTKGQTEPTTESQQQQSAKLRKD